MRMPARKQASPTISLSRFVAALLSEIEALQRFLYDRDHKVISCLMNDHMLLLSEIEALHGEGCYMIIWS